MRRIAAAILFIVICLLYVLFCRYCPPKSHVAPEYIKEKMKYHGVEVVYEDWNGKLYFRRNGKRCEL